MERHIEKISLAHLVDIELDNAQITGVHDASAGPSNDEITFSGFIKDNAEVQHQRTYSCKLDGSELKVLATKNNYPATAPAYAPLTRTAFASWNQVREGK
ncbi:hypothetical protein EON83_14920 [bacterium]|nr:MAG: hypothetical protein EON83_14920 [bacterium]